MNTKILFEFNIQSITDIITNSSSELFVFKNRELEDLVLILSLIHPYWNLEYNEPIQVNRMRDDELATYLEWIYMVDQILIMKLEIFLLLKKIQNVQELLNILD